MALPDGFLDEIKARIRLSDLIGRTVALRRQGREFTGLSPFKKERTPSFFVNDEKGFYHCFSSQKHGDAISWLEETQGLSFIEAVETLAAEAGLAMPAPDPDAARKDARRKELVEWNALAQTFFARQLMTAEGSAAREYLERRGLGPDDWKRFGLGYAPDRRTALKDYLVNEGARPDELVEAGLLIAPEDGGAAFDRFRGRIMFPISDPRGRLVAFGGRAMAKDARAKYMNSPETPLFHKGQVLYRYPEARAAAAEPTAKIRGLIVAEGYMDVIALNRAGLVHSVAPLGTALTEDQLRLLWRAGPEPVICLDGDSAGQRAAGLAAERALPLLEPGKTLRFVFLPDGQDPDDVLRAKGAEALRNLLADTRRLVDMLWEREWALEPLDDPDRRAGFRRRLRALTAKIADPDVKAEYKAEFDRRLSEAFGRRSVREPWRGRRDKDGLPDGPPLAKTQTLFAGKHHSAEVLWLLWIAVQHPKIIVDEAETLSEIDFRSLQPFKDAMLDVVFENGALEKGALISSLKRMGFAPIVDYLEANWSIFESINAAPDMRSQDVGLAWRRKAASYMERQEQRSSRQRSNVVSSAEPTDEEFRRGVEDVTKSRRRR